MNILVTGSSGFVGSYFIQKYMQKYQIQKFSFLKNDMLNCTGVDVVLHLSALVHQMGGASKNEYEKVNVTQTLSLARKAKKSGVKHFIFMSSVKVYGEESDSFYTEDTVCNPEDEYGKSKLKAENELRKLVDNDFFVSIIRTPIIYGQGVKANIKSLINLVRKAPILPLHNTNNRRSMVYIGNICHLIDELIQKKVSGIFLASDDKILSTSEFINLIAKKTNTKMILLYIPFFETLLKLVKPSFYKRLYCSLEIDNTKTKEILNFKNLYSVDEGVDLMINSGK